MSPALTTLRNQLTVKHDEPSVSPADERILLAKAWLESSPGAQDVFVAWDNASAVSRPQIHTKHRYLILRSGNLLSFRW